MEKIFKKTNLDVHEGVLIKPLRDMIINTYHDSRYTIMGYWERGLRI